MDHFVEIDLYSYNSYIASVDTGNNRVFKKKVRKNLSEIIKH